MNKVRIYFIHHQGGNDLDKIDDSVVKSLLTELAPDKRTSILRLLNYSDRLTSLLGLYLLKCCAQAENIADFSLLNVEYPHNGKPFYNAKHSNFDFNISHSENLVVVAASNSVKLGVDVEKIRRLKSLKFRKIMRPEELGAIQDNPKLFFELWSKKEAVVKAANTVGLARMRDVALRAQLAVLDETTWYLRDITLSDWLQENYAIHMATSEPVEELIVKQVLLSDVNQ